MFHFICLEGPTGSSDLLRCVEDTLQTFFVDGSTVFLVCGACRSIVQIQCYYIRPHRRRMCIGHRSFQDVRLQVCFVVPGSGPIISFIQKWLSPTFHMENSSCHLVCGCVLRAALLTCVSTLSKLYSVIIFMENCPCRKTTSLYCQHCL